MLQACDVSPPEELFRVGRDQVWLLTLVKLCSMERKIFQLM
jgi:hypothetical protein